MVSRANTLGVVSIRATWMQDAPSDAATYPQAVPLFSKARFLGKANCAYWYFVVESFPSSHQLPR